MAPLIDCPECGRQISSEAHSCPQCGKPGAASVNATMGTLLEKPSLIRAAKQGAFWLAVVLSISKIGTSELLGKIMGGDFGQAELDLILLAAKTSAPLTIALGFTLLSTIPLLGLVTDFLDGDVDLIGFIGSLPFIFLPVFVTMGITALGLRNDLSIISIWNETRTFIGPLNLTHTRNFIEHFGSFLYQFEVAFWGKYSFADWLNALAFTAYFCWILIVIAYRWLVDKADEKRRTANKKDAPDQKSVK